MTRGVLLGGTHGRLRVVVIDAGLIEQPALRLTCRYDLGGRSNVNASA
jgi:hypothetical protein